MTGSGTSGTPTKLPSSGTQKLPAVRSEVFRHRFYGDYLTFPVRPALSDQGAIAVALQGDRQALYDALREEGVVALGWPWVGLVLHLWRLAVSHPSCSPAARKEARTRLNGIGPALAGRGRGRVEDQETARLRAFSQRYLPILREHLKVLRPGCDVDLRKLTDVGRWRYLKLRQAGFRAADVNRRTPGPEGSAYAILARTLGYDERYVRKLTRPLRE